MAGGGAAGKVPRQPVALASGSQSPSKKSKAPGVESAVDDCAAKLEAAEHEPERRQPTLAGQLVSGKGINSEQNKESSGNASKHSWDGGRDSSVCVQEK